MWIKILGGGGGGGGRGIQWQASCCLNTATGVADSTECIPVSSFFFCVPSYFSGVHHFGWDSCICDSFSNPTIEVFTFHLHGWCMLGVFLLLVFTRLGHGCQDLLSPCDGMHVCTDKTLVFTLIRRVFLEMESEPMVNFQGNPPPPPPSTWSSEEDRTHNAALRRTASPTHNWLSYSGPHLSPILGSFPLLEAWLLLRTM